jgi:hypothetical protein
LGRHLLRKKRRKRRILMTTTGTTTPITILSRVLRPDDGCGDGDTELDDVPNVTLVVVLRAVVLAGRSEAFQLIWMSGA